MDCDLICLHILLFPFPSYAHQLLLHNSILGSIWFCVWQTLITWIVKSSSTYLCPRVLLHTDETK